MMNEKSFDALFKKLHCPCYEQLIAQMSKDFVNLPQNKSIVILVKMQQKTKIDIVQLIKRDALWLSARFHKTLKKEAILFKNHSEISKWQLIQINTAYYSNQSKLDNQIIGRSKVEKLLSGFMTVKSNLFSRSGFAALG